MGQIFVKVRNVSTDDNGTPTMQNGLETVITYRSYNLTPDKYELLYQCDENGKQVFLNGQANPNLGAQHRATAQKRSADSVVNSGPTDREKELERQLAETRALLAQSQNNPPVQSEKPEPEKVNATPPPAPQVLQKKRGPKKTQTTEQVA